MLAKKNNMTFGNINIAIFGDHGQLQPVKDCSTWTEKYFDHGEDEDEEYEDK